jgi:8-oxo-dGTP diphosphatase
MTPTRVTAALIRRRDEILITRRAPDEKLAGKWEFPGGKIEPDETPEECLARELYEELGIESEVGAKFGEVLYEYADGAILLMAYWTRWTAGELRLTVHDKLKWAQIRELHEHRGLAPADVLLVQKLAETD